MCGTAIWHRYFYSEARNAALKDAAKKGLVNEEVLPAVSRGKNMHIYSITEKGQKALKGKTAALKSERDSIY